MNKDTLMSMLESGESQSLEFKREFPKTAKYLAKEIAAFATSNRGIILIGVDDSGTVTGLDEAATHEGRRGLVGRVEGICSTCVAPTVSPKISFVQIRSRWIMAIEVEKGAEAIYFADGRPYIRQITAARVATPEEVRGHILGAELIQRIEALEARKTPEQSVAAAIAGQGDLATMNLSQLRDLFDRLFVADTRLF